MKGIVNWAALQSLAMRGFNGGALHKQMQDNPGEFWGKSAAMYNKMARLEEEYTRNQLEILILEPSDSVLDIGCGPGRLAVPIARKAARVTALMWLPKCWRYVSRTPGKQGSAILRPACSIGMMPSLGTISKNMM